MCMIPAAHANPFGVLPQEAGFTPNSTWWGQLLSYLLLWQSQFQTHITTFFTQVSATPDAKLALIISCFGYGVVHSVGPGHGKLVMSAWLVAQRNARLKQAVAFSSIAAITQSTIAIALVGIIFAIFNLTQSAMANTIYALGLLTGIVFIAMGGRLLWRQVHPFFARAPIHTHDAHCGCAHHKVQPDELPAHIGRELAISAMASGLRPCTGAILVLTLAFANNAAIWGVLAVLAMGLGVAIGLLCVALIVVYGKWALAKVSRNGQSPALQLAMRIIELLAAILLLIWGIITLISAR